MTRLTILMGGPYRSTGSAQSRFPDLPIFCDAAEVVSCGVYLQVVKLAETYRVSYVGETGKNCATFSTRLPKENADWLSGRDTSKRQYDASGNVRELDPPSFRMGLRLYLRPAKDKQEQRRMRQEVLNDTLLFLGPLPPAMVEERKNIEAAIIRRLKDRAPSEVAEFVYNKLFGLTRQGVLGLFLTTRTSDSTSGKWSARWGWVRERCNVN